MHRFKFLNIFAAAGVIAASALIVSPRTAQAIPLAPAPALDSQITDVQYKVRAAPRRAVAVRPARPVARPGVRPAVRPGRPVVVAPGYRPGRPVVVAPARRYYYGNWYRPYRWNPGAAIAAGAAIGFIGAAAAASYYGPPPAPGLCWYYTNPSRTAGFWDVCPY
ncbi:MAG: hypothetical protein ACK4MV_00890 [Beijerinckiaceae bacterium]